MSGLSESLHRILEIDGARTVALVDVGTGMIVDSAGEEPAGLTTAAASLADEARLAGGAPGSEHSGGDLEEMLVVMPERVHLLKVLSRSQGEGLMLFVDVDRARTNAALAAMRVSQFAPAVLG
ncbi:MAG: hypothetical protein ACRDPO_10105 [Streptosporangiaceae bacterium]